MSDDTKAPDSEPSKGEYFTNIERPREVYQNIVWWNAHLFNQDAHTTLIPYIERERLSQATRYNNMRRLIAIYEWGYKASQTDTQADASIADFTNAYNALQNVVETVHASICKNPTVPMPLTTGGGYLQRKRAKDLQKALEGEYDQNGVEQIQDDVALDFLTIGAGFSKVFSEFGALKIEHVPAEDMTVGESEGRYRRPRAITQSTPMDRYVAYELYGGDEEWLHGDQANRREKILKCKAATNLGSNSASDNDQIMVHEAYHLPSGPESGDGRIAIVIDGCTLVDRRRDRKMFPYAPCIPRPRRRGYWGLSMAHEMAANQREYERGTANHQRAIQKMAGNHIIAPRGANLKPEDLTPNADGDLIIYDGQIPPREWNISPLNGEAIQYTEGIPGKMMQSRGVSATGATGETPAGLANASGKARQLVRDEQNGRLKPYYRAIDRWHVLMCQLIIDEARELCGRDPKYAVSYASERALERVEWAKVLIDEGDFVLRIFPVSALSQDPAAMFEQLQEMRASGDITTEQFKRLFRLPDLEAENEIDTADTDIIDRNLDIIVTEGRYLSPEPFDNLELAKVRAGKFYNVCRARGGVPESHLQMLRDYVADCASLLEQAKPPPPPPMPGEMPPGGPPMGGPPMPGGPGLEAPPLAYPVNPNAPPGMPPGMPPMAA